MLKQQQHKDLIDKITLIEDNLSSANGRFFVRETDLSKSLSAISFRMHPAERIKKTPKRNTIKISLFGIPFADSHKPHKVGHKSKKIPIGRFNLINIR